MVRQLKKKVMWGDTTPKSPPKYDTDLKPTVQQIDTHIPGFFLYYLNSTS